MFQLEEGGDSTVERVVRVVAAADCSFVAQRVAVYHEPDFEREFEEVAGTGCTVS